MAAILKVDNLSAAYGGIQALRGVSLEVQEGEIVSVLGANGAGKSTLLKCISSVMKTTGGTVEFMGKPASKKPYEVVEAGLVQVPEARQIFAKLTVYENLRIGSNFRKDQSGIKEDIERVYSIFPRLKEREKQYGGLLSGGEQQMLAIGRGMMARPKLMMFDEPSLGLAPVIVQQVFEVIKELKQRGAFDNAYRAERSESAQHQRPCVHHADRQSRYARHRKGASGRREYGLRVSGRISLIRERNKQKPLRYSRRGFTVI